jgi:hypothetical protein
MEPFLVAEREESEDEVWLFPPEVLPAVGAELEDENIVVPFRGPASVPVPVVKLLVLPVDVAAPTPNVVVNEPDIIDAVAEAEVTDASALNGVEAPGPAFAA